MKIDATGTTGTRYALLDTIRGAVIISMTLYHALWDIVYLLGIDIAWYRGNAAFIWQQSICWTFIFLAGFCWSLGKRPLRRGLIVFGAGLLVTTVTVVAMPSNRVVFGVLTLLGSCMLLLIPLDKLLQKIPAALGLCGSAVLFIGTRNINEGFLGFGSWNFVRLPQELYHGLPMTFLGFSEKSFQSTDYFSLLPWLFLFVAGYFAFRFFRERDLLTRYCKRGFAPLSFLGRHSMLIYLLHQPVIYLACSLWNGGLL